MITSKTIEMIKRHEGTKRDKKGRHIPYRCTKGRLTVGYGHNLDANGLSQKIVDAILIEDLAIAEIDARFLFRSFDKLNDVRQGVLIDMALQMGRDNLGEFKNTIKAVDKGDWQWAKKEMLDSDWARDDAPERADELANLMQRGAW